MEPYKQNKTNCRETGKFETGMDFYIPIGVILVELNSNDDTRIKTMNFTENEVNNLMDNLDEIMK